MTAKKDYYKILKIPSNASIKDIKAAYHSLALDYHPDRVSENYKDIADEMFKDISEAYQVLSDIKKKSVYDRGLKTTSDQKQDFTYDASVYADMFKEKEFVYPFNLSLPSMSRVLSLCVAFVYMLFVFIAVWPSGFGIFIIFLPILSLPLSLIWFGRYFSLIDNIPGVFFEFIGWVLLLMPVWLKGCHHMGTFY